MLKGKIKGGLQKKKLAFFLALVDFIVLKFALVKYNVCPHV